MRNQSTATLLLCLLAACSEGPESACPFDPASKAAEIEKMLTAAIADPSTVVGEISAAAPAADKTWDRLTEAALECDNSLWRFSDACRREQQLAPMAVEQALDVMVPVSMLQRDGIKEKIGFGGFALLPVLSTLQAMNGSIKTYSSLRPNFRMEDCATAIGDALRADSADNATRVPSR